MASVSNGLAARVVHRTRQVAAAAFTAIVLASCGVLSEIGDQTGIACQHPPRQVEGADGRNPFGPGEPFANVDPTTMAAGRVAAIAAQAGLEVTYRLSYGIGPPDEAVTHGYSECWCVPPPIGRVTDLAFDSGGRLVIFVASGQTLSEPRRQPRMGWGCQDDGEASRAAPRRALGQSNQRASA